MVFHRVRKKVDALLLPLVAERASVMYSLRRALVQGINEDHSCAAVLVPHADRYPEIADIRNRNMIPIDDSNEQHVLELLQRSIQKSASTGRRI